MAKALRQWIDKPLYVYLLGLFFLIDRTTQFFFSFNAGLFLVLYGSYCLITFLLLFLLRRTILRKGANLFILLLWILVLFFSEINNWLSQTFHLYNYKIRYLFGIYVLIFLAVFFIQRKLSYAIVNSFNKVINSFLLICSLVSLINGITIYRKERAHQLFLQKSGKELNAGNNSKHDIIWILMDEYGAPACLKSELQFNDLLVDSLKQRGFWVSDSMPSRSDLTILSINSLFNLDDTIPPANFMYAAKYLKQGEWVTQLNSTGYKFTALDFLDMPQNNVLKKLPYFPYDYFDQLVYGTLLWSLNETFLYHNDAFDSYNQGVAQEVCKVVNKKETRPQFIWAHLLIPHMPFCRDKDGVFIKKTANYKLAKEEEISKEYLDYLVYGNSVVLKLLNSIPDIKNKTIIISGDHGFRFPYLGAHNPVRKATFCAVYYPGMDTTELNGIRYLQQIPFHLHY